MRIGSVTKTITADVVLQLAGQNRLDLDDPVSKFLPATRNGSAMTVRQLLDMTAGVFNFTEDDYFNRALDATPQRALDRGRDDRHRDGPPALLRARGGASTTPTRTTRCSG